VLEEQERHARSGGWGTSSPPSRTKKLSPVELEAKRWFDRREKQRRMVQARKTRWSASPGKLQDEETVRAKALRLLKRLVHLSERDVAERCGVNRKALRRILGVPQTGPIRSHLGLDK